jgi:AcrR family transcriptional regulator
MAKSPAGRPTLDGNAVRTQRTRERILAVALELFNGQGEAHVTTGTIASELGISPGNLYYHFRNKDEIVERLFARFEERIDIEPSVQLDGPGAIEDLWLYLHLMFEGIWEYRFLYRNLDDITSRNRRLRAQINRIFDRKARIVERLCAGLVGAGAMRASPGEIRTLAANVLVVATYWLNYQSLRGVRDNAGGDELGAGAYHVMALVAPYLVGAAREHLDHLSGNYIE